MSDLWGHMMIGEHYACDDEDAARAELREARLLLEDEARDRQQAEAHELMLEREQECRRAIREALSCGVSMEAIECLCRETGVSYDSVVG